jgi:hypothetical protein
MNRSGAQRADGGVVESQNEHRRTLHNVAEPPTPWACVFVSITNPAPLLPPVEAERGG